MKYRPITDLSNEEITFILKDIFEADEVRCIAREAEKVTAKIIMSWENWDTGLRTSRIDTVSLYEPGHYVECPLICDFDVPEEDVIKWEQFCMAKGCHSLWKNNPYVPNAKG